MDVCVHLQTSKQTTFLDKLSKIIDHNSSIYDNCIILCIILGYFNMEPSNCLLSAYMQSHNLFNLIKSNICFRGSDSCIDLILTNRTFRFKNSSAFDTGLSDHHHLKRPCCPHTFESPPLGPTPRPPPTPHCSSFHKPPWR